MKYIRTKDGIYEIKEDLGDYLVMKKGEIIYPTIIERTADTIEELCDIFVLDNVIPCLIHLSKTKGYYYYYGDSDKQSCLMPIYKEYKIYGAIWTNKGLIYVAKMNDKGELELL